jgi:hypothetical protein
MRPPDLPFNFQIRIGANIGIYKISGYLNPYIYWRQDFSGKPAKPRQDFWEMATRIQELRDNTSGEEDSATRLLWMNIARQDFSLAQRPNGARDKTSGPAVGKGEGATRLQGGSESASAPRQEFNLPRHSRFGATRLQIAEIQGLAGQPGRAPTRRMNPASANDSSESEGRSRDKTSSARDNTSGSQAVTNRIDFPKQLGSSDGRDT